MKGYRYVLTSIREYQERQCTSKITMRHIRVTIVAMEKENG
jgi:hypothetical protein